MIHAHIPDAYIPDDNFRAALNRKLGQEEDTADFTYQVKCGVWVSIGIPHNRREL